MMGLDSLGLGNAGDMSKTIMAIIGIGISAIILLTFAPKISGDVSQIALLGNPDGYCEVNGETFDRVIAKGDYNNPDHAWRETGPTKQMLAETDTGLCDVAGITDVAADASSSFFTPQGELVKVSVPTGGTAKSTLDVGEWKPQSTALAAGGLGTLIQLLFGVMGLLIPAGALGYLGGVGADLVANRFGGGIATSILVVVVGVVVVGAILPQIIEPLDTFFAAMDGNRYYIFSVG